MSQAPSLVRKAPIEKQLVTPGLREAPVAPRQEAREIGLQERPFQRVPIQAMAMHHQHLTVPNPRPPIARALEMGVDLGAALGRKWPRLRRIDELQSTNGHDRKHPTGDVSTDS